MLGLSSLLEYVADSVPVVPPNSSPSSSSSTMICSS